MKIYNIKNKQGTVIASANNSSTSSFLMKSLVDAHSVEIKFHERKGERRVMKQQNNNSKHSQAVAKDIAERLRNNYIQQEKNR